MSHVGDDFISSFIRCGPRTNNPLTTVFTLLHLELAEGTLNSVTGLPLIGVKTGDIYRVLST